MKKGFVISLLTFGFLIMIPATIPASVLQSQEKCPTPVVDIGFEKAHILELAKKDLTLAFVVARSQINSKPIGEVVMVSWTPVDITQSDLNSLLENDGAWLEQYTERAKKVGRSGVGAAIFHIKITDLGNKRLRYTIIKAGGAHKPGGLNQASFEMGLDLGGKRAVSTRCLL
jgi:hypothetical protein